MPRYVKIGIVILIIVGIAGAIYYFYFDEPDPVMVKAGGILTDLQGNPIDDAIIYLFPNGGKTEKLCNFHSAAPTTATRDKGKFQFFYIMPEKVIPSGPYRVVIRPYYGEDNKTKIPEKYHRPDTSPLKVTIPRTGIDNLHFKIEID